MKILLVEDEKIKRMALHDDLNDAGYETDAASNASEGLSLLQRSRFDVVVTDLRMKGMDGIEFLAKIKENWPETDVIMITAYATVDNAVQAMKLGAFDYITKPFESNRLIHILEKIDKIRRLTSENVNLKAELAKATRHGDIIGQGESMRDAFELLDTAIESDVPILLCGETGTGKELFATAIHHCGPRKDKPFIRVSCAALSAQLMESELFGHERGAFTGALDSKPGRFELAHTGTLFLDEVDDVPLGVQVKLLRVIEGHPFERVGGITSITTDVRIVAASKVDLKTKVADGTFRGDLYYRLSVFPISIPPLRNRREDIPLLVDHFLKKYVGTAKPPVVSEEAMAILWDYSWPGNVRELQNIIHRILLGLSGRPVITKQDIPADIRLAILEQANPKKEPKSFREMIEANERELLVKALNDADGNQSKAAASLDMKLSTFRDKLTKYAIQVVQGLVGSDLS